MPKDSVTLALDGEVSLSDFAIALDSLNKLIDALGSEVAKGTKIDWVIEQLEAGSAVATARGIPQEDKDLPIVETVVNAYELVGKDLENGNPINFSERVRNPACKIVGLVNGRIPSVRFETVDREFIVSSNPENEGIRVNDGKDMKETTHGGVRGRVQSLSNRRGLQFTLYDLLKDHSIRCYLKPGSEEIMINSWGQIADVEGIVRRDLKTGQPISIREVKNVRIVPEGEKGGWRKVRGVAPATPGSMTSAEAVRAVRDA